MSMFDIASLVNKYNQNVHAYRNRKKNLIVPKKEKSAARFHFSTSHDVENILGLYLTRLDASKTCKYNTIFFFEGVILCVMCYIFNSRNSSYQNRQIQSFLTFLPNY